MASEARAFTLIELLVTVVIVALLAAVGFGVYGGAITARNQAESAARLRQWGAALASYASDNSGSLPCRGQGIQPVTQLDRREDWFNALPPFMGQPAYCDLLASGRRPKENEHSIFIRPGAKDPGGPVFLSYGMNMNLSPWNLPQPTFLAAIERPAATVFLAESSGKYASTYPSSRPYGCVAPYAGKGNILFLDGHVSAFDAAYLGVGKGDPHRDDVRWLTGTASDAQASNY